VNKSHFPPGSRVRIRQSLVPGLPELQEEGVVTRSDARGVLIRFDSGRTTIVEPRVLTLIAPPSGS
jgi:hypothetical protein